MRSQSNSQVKVAGRPPSSALASLAANADGLTFPHAGWDVDSNSVRFGLAGARVHALEGDGARGTMHDFVERDQNIAFDVCAPHGEFLLAFRTALAATKHAFRAAEASAA